MTQEQTVKILELLNAFYAGGKNDPKQQVIAWHLVLEKYDFDDAMRAVISFAEHDDREYAQFPGVGRIVGAIRREDARKDAFVREVIKAVQYGRPYETLTGPAKKLIPEESYQKWLDVDPEEFAGTAERYADFLRKRQKNLMIEQKEGPHEAV